MLLYPYPRAYYGNFLSDGTSGGIRNILVFKENVVASLAYTDVDGWTVLAKTTDPSEFEVLVDSTIELWDGSLADKD